MENRNKTIVLRFVSIINKKINNNKGHCQTGASAFLFYYYLRAIYFLIASALKSFNRSIHLIFIYLLCERARARRLLETDRREKKWDFQKERRQILRFQKIPTGQLHWPSHDLHPTSTFTSLFILLRNQQSAWHLQKIEQQQQQKQMITIEKKNNNSKSVCEKRYERGLENQLINIGNAAFVWKKK